MSACGHTPLFMDSLRGPERLEPCLWCERDALRQALQGLEVAANTAVFCYSRRPENFAMALKSLDEETEKVRQLSSRVRKLSSAEKLESQS